MTPQQVEIYYNVPYRGGFDSGVYKCKTLEEAIEKAKYADGDIYKITSEIVQKSGCLIVNKDIK